jgi:MFS family permease
MDAASGRMGQSEIDPAGRPQRPGRDRWAIVGLLMAFALIGHFNRLSISAAGDARIMAQYGISPTRMGLVYSAFLFTYTLFMIPGGWLLDHFGARAALMTVGFGSAAFVALTGVVGLGVTDVGRLVAALIVVRGLMGIVSAPLHPACARAVGSWVEPGGRSRANGLVTGAALVGIAVAPAGFGALIARFDWPVAFLLAGLATAGLTLVWAAYATDRPEPHPSADRGGWDRIARGATVRASGAGAGYGAGWLALLRNRSLILLTLSYAAVGYFQYLFFYWMTYYFQSVLSLHGGASRSYAAVPPLAMAVGMPLGGWVSDRVERVLGPRLGRRVVPMTGMSAGAVFLVLGVVAREPVWVVAWFALAMGAVGAAEGPFWATAIALGGKRGGSSAALFNTGGNAGGILAPILTPWVGERLGWTWAIGLGGLVCLSGVALWLGIDPGEDPSEEAGDAGG